MKEAAERVERLVWLLNHHIETEADAEALYCFYERAPDVSRPVVVGEEVRLEPVFQGSPSAGVLALRVGSGWIHPGDRLVSTLTARNAMPWYAITARGARRDPPARPRRVPPEALERDRRILRTLVGAVVNAKGSEKTEALERMRQWSRLRYGECVTPHAVVNPATDAAQVWAGGVASQDVRALWGLLEHVEDLMPRLKQCWCGRFVFSPPGHMGPVREHCSDDHAKKYRDAKGTFVHALRQATLGEVAIEQLTPRLLRDYQCEVTRLRAAAGNRDLVLVGGLRDVLEDERDAERIRRRLADGGRAS